MTQVAMTEQPLKVEISRWLSQAWECFLASAWLNVLIGLIGAALVTALLPLIGPVSAGFAMTGIRKCRNGRVELADFFAGFGNFFLGALAAGLLITLFVIIGFALCIIPGLVIAGMYMFTFHFMADRKQDFWQAMESSRKLVARDYFGFVMFGLVLLVINFVGVTLVVGCLVTFPWTAYAVSAAYYDCVGSASAPAPESAPIHID